MSTNLESFANDKYLILKILYKHQLRVGDNMFVPLSQQEIATIAECSKPKINKRMQELSQEGYITSLNGLRGKYVITEKGYDVINTFREKEGYNE